MQRRWVFRRPDEKYDPKMIDERPKGKQLSQMVWGSIWIDRRGRPCRSPLIIMERDPTTHRNGYSAQSYIETLELGLLPYYRPGEVFQQDNAGIYRARIVHRFF
jgi:hypothetical protein